MYSTRLPDFINHGILPFGGRSAEQERIATFIAAGNDRDTIRVLLVEGEGGIGKSRLIEETLADSVPPATILLHLKIAPGGTGSVCRLAADALRGSHAAQSLLREQPDPTVGGVAIALARCARLRPMLLVIEDLHLLEGGTLKEFGLLLDALDEEPVVLLAAARTGELPARGLLQRLDLEELHLEGLSPAMIASLWQELFGAVPAESLVDILHGATAGNPLALRSALRAAINQDALVERAGGGWQTEPPFAAIVKRNARAIADGMTAHLDRRVRAAAASLAGIGELFSREAAEMVVEPSLIDDFIFEGILHELERPRPTLSTLPKSIHPILGFTHSLLHRQLAERSTLPLVTIIRILAAHAPLYSVMPLTAITMHADERDELLTLELDVVRGAITALFNISAEIDKTADWASALSILEGGESLLEWSRERFGDEYPLQRASVIARRIDLLRRTIASPEYASSLRDLDAVTADPPNEPMARLRLFAISFSLWSGTIEQEPAFEEAVALVERFPALREHRFFIVTLREFAQVAAEADNREIRRRIASELDRLAPDSNARALARREVEPHLLTLFDSPEELAGRLELYGILREQSGGEGSVLSSVEPFFLWATGRIDEMKRVVELSIPLLKGRGLQRSTFSREMLLLQACALDGLDLDTFVTGCRELDAEQTAAGIDDNRRLPGELVLAASIVGDERWRAAAIEHVAQSAVGLLREDFATMYADIVAEREGAIGVEDRDFDSVMPIFRLDQIPRLRALVRRISSAGDHKPGGRPAEALVAGMRWLEERGLTEVMAALLDDGAGVLESREAAIWTKKIEKLRSERKREGGTRKVEGGAGAESEGMVVTMLGRIEIRRPGVAEPVQPRGARQKSFLGAMIASEMLAHPLERDRFLDAVGIDPTEGKLARDAVNSAIYRLRDILGPDAILTEGETPRLNPAAIRCDLVDAHRHLQRAIDAARRGDLRRGGAALLQALDITAGEVPFPTLYESLFEALRDEFETRLRKAVLDIGGRLIEEGDVAVAERTLALATAALAGDDDVALLYCQALDLAGKSAEAALVRNKLEKSF